MPAQNRRPLVVLVAAVAVLAVTAALSVVGYRHSSHAKSLDDERGRVSVIAGQLAVDFTSVDYRHLTQDFNRTAAHATPAFAKEYLKTVKSFAPLYRHGKVILTTSVDVTGITSLTPDSAVVLVALKGTATNTSATGGTQQLYRMQVDLTKSGNTWLASNVEPM